MIGSGLVLISSRQRTRGDNAGSYVCDLTNMPCLSNCRHWVVKSISIPHLFGNVNQYRNKLTIREIGAGAGNGGAPATFTLAQGHYTIANFATIVNNLIAPVFPGLTLAIGNYYNNGLIHAVFTSTRGLPFVIEYTELAEVVFGFSRGQQSTGATLVGTYPVNLAGTRHLYLMSKDIAPGNMICPNRCKDVVDIVDLGTTPFGGYVTRTAEDMRLSDYSYREQTPISQIEIVVADEQFRPLDLPFNYHVEVTMKLLHMDSGHIAAG